MCLSVLIVWNCDHQGSERVRCDDYPNCVVEHDDYNPEFSKEFCRSCKEVTWVDKAIAMTETRLGIPNDPVFWKRRTTLARLEFLKEFPIAKGNGRKPNPVEPSLELFKSTGMFRPGTPMPEQQKKS